MRAPLFGFPPVVNTYPGIHIILSCARPLFLVLLLPIVCAGRADQVEMQNGDRYSGKVLSVDVDHVVIQSEVLGKISLPRRQAALISIGPKATASNLPTNSAPNTAASSSAVTDTNKDLEISAALKTLQSNSNLVQQVQTKFLADAGPEANKKFNDLLSGLITGKMTMSDLRSEAKTAADQLRSLKKELGDDSGFALDSYLAILDNFLKEMPASSNASTNNSHVVQ
jgi:hypothetical protein